jgi:hypothetical protein
VDHAPAVAVDLAAVAAAVVVSDVAVVAAVAVVVAPAAANALVAVNAPVVAIDDSDRRILESRPIDRP